jgi:PIN domain nuclease of toxin-antitoxin system
VPFIADTSAILAYAFKETGHEVVESILGDCALSAVNFSEFVAKLHDKGLSEPDLKLAVGSMTNEIVDFDAEQAVECGRLRPLTRHLGLSFGDRACLALARLRKRAVLTADRTWSSLDIGVEIKLIR